MQNGAGETVLADIATGLRLKRYRSAGFVISRLCVRYLSVPFIKHFGMGAKAKVIQIGVI
jgi:hypothetical protein